MILCWHLRGYFIYFPILFYSLPRNLTVSETQHDRIFEGIEIVFKERFLSEGIYSIDNVRKYIVKTIILEKNDSRNPVVQFCTCSSRLDERIYLCCNVRLGLVRLNTTQVDLDICLSHSELDPLYYMQSKLQNHNGHTIKGRVSYKRNHQYVRNLLFHLTEEAPPLACLQ